LIGRVPGCEGLVLATGHNGYGIMLTPVSGVLTANAVECRPNPLLKGVEPDREFQELRGPF
jgi:glycine/D-amino acid oxidase-like deaminating enzyme